MSASTALAPSLGALEERLARADLFRFLAACYYEPEPVFAEERLFDSMHDAAARIDAGLAREVGSLGKAFAADSLEELRVDHARLFLVPSDGDAKPYASLWTPGTSVQDCTNAVLGLYAEGGFEIDESFRELPDHIAAELEFVYRLLYEDAPASLRARFIAQHLARWIRPFSEAVQASARTAFYRQLAPLTERVVAGEASRLQ